MGKKLLGTALNINSKYKKKFKLTKQKLILNHKNVKSAISFLLKNCQDNKQSKIKRMNKLKKYEKKIDKEDLENLDNSNILNIPIYLYIILKNKITDEENLKRVKDKLFPIKNTLITEENGYKIAIIEDDFKPEELTQINEGGMSKFLNYFKKEEFKSELKKFIETNLNIDDKYQILLCNSKYKLNLPKNSNNINFIHKDISEIKQVLTGIKEGKSLLKIDKYNNGQIFRIKCGLDTMDKENIFNNILNLIYKIVSYILCNLKEYNEVETLILKTEDSIPLAINGHIPVDMVDYFK